MTDAGKSTALGYIAEAFGDAAEYIELAQLLTGELMPA